MNRIAQQLNSFKKPLKQKIFPKNEQINPRKTTQPSPLCNLLRFQSKNRQHIVCVNNADGPQANINVIINIFKCKR